MDMLFSLLLAFSSFICFTGSSDEGCDSPQYVSIGKQGVLKCSFHGGFRGILWYNSTDTESTEPILQLFENEKEGKGFLTGEYDILPNGSLIIKTVSPIHEKVFTVVKVSSLTEDPEQFHVVVITTVFPQVGEPIIDGCDIGALCHRKLDSNSYLNCFVRDARPSFLLKWMLRTSHGDKNATTQFNATENGLTHSLIASTQDAFYYTTMLSLLVCRAESPRGLLKRKESIVLIENNLLDTSAAVPLRTYVSLGEKLELKCSKDEPFFLIWKRKLPQEKNYINLIYSTPEKNFTNIEIDIYKLGKAGSLLADEVRIEHEGLYYCLYGDGITDGVTVYDVIVYVDPVPPYPIVDECGSQKTDCMIEVEEEGAIKCSLKNVRPKVQLEWVLVYNSSSVDIDFTEEISNVYEEDGTFDVYLSHKYRFLSQTKRILIVECKVTGKHAAHFNSRQKVILMRKNREADEPKEPNEKWMYWIIPIAVAVAVTLFCAAVLLKRFRPRHVSNQSTHREPEEIPMLEHHTRTDVEGGQPGNVTPTSDHVDKSRYLQGTLKLSPDNSSLKENVSPETTTEDNPEEQGTLKLSPDNSSLNENVSPETTTEDNPEEQGRLTSTISSPFNLNGAKDKLVNQLKEKYKDIYSAVYPLPYDHNQAWSVEMVFVDGLIEFRPNIPPNKAHWEKLASRLDILSDSRMKTNRRILEGDPGYGKSILFLQLAYDWVNKVDGSSLNDVEILIFLRLKQVHGKNSFFKAIKQCILPKDSRLTEEVIEEIIYNSQSVLILLDGFNEYADREADNDTDIFHILSRKMFHQFEVILSTRTSCLPKGYAARTERLRLVGFDDTAQEEYISKIWPHKNSGDYVKNTASLKKFKSQFMKNPVFRDLCKVPLFFVALAHASHDSSLFKSCRSITSFFNYIFWCFQIHAITKRADKDITKNNPLEEINGELIYLAFDGINTKKEIMTWQKQEMCDLLGQETYDDYIQVGILVEEEAMRISYGAKTAHFERIQNRKEVRFFHDIACQWYAAHYLAEHAFEDEDGNLCVSEKVFNREGVSLSTEDTTIQEGDYNPCRIDPSTYYYVFRFACGLNKTAASIITRYLKRKHNLEKLVIQCTFENDGNLKAMVNHVKKLCASPIHIRHDDTLVSQKSTVEVLEIVSENKIPISRLKLFDSFKSVEISANCLYLRSNLRLPSLPTLKILWLDEGGREMTKENTEDLIDCLSLYINLESLRLSGCLLPKSVDTDVLLPYSYRGNLTTSVMWDPRYTANWYYLNFESGLWERGGEVMTERDYENERRVFNERNNLKRLRSNSIDVL